MVIAAGLELVGVGESLNTAGAIDLQEDHQGSGTLMPFAEPQGDKNVRVPSEEERKRRWTVMAITVGGLLAFHNDAIGFLAGMLCHWSFQLQDRLRNRQAQRGQIRLDGDEPHEDAEASPELTR